MGKLSTVPENINFPTEERKVLERWRKENTFHESLRLSEGRPHYTFYDGPPFATGLPHYGHILAGTVKDVVTRWAHQTGHHVERRFGWDTHGLPVEFEVDKTIGIKGPADVMAMGIKNYNDECRKIVMRYAGEWRNTVERMGRWIDFDKDYKTLYPWFMESVWWVFSQLVKKDLVYRGVKVMPFSTGCSTPLSNFEAGQNYKDVVDPAAFVGFALRDKPNRYLVAWTTTPWTLPSNLAIAVHPDLKYVAVKDKASGKELVVMEERVHQLYKSTDDYQVLETFDGKALSGKKYEPVFPYFRHLEDEGRKVFRVLLGTFITTDQGTGVVHQAPYFGEIDFQTCLENGVIEKDSKMTCPVDEKGLFTDEVPDYKGMYVKDADKHILKRLKETGNLIKSEQTKHSYPFCWRSETPLLYKAVPSWFIRVESFVPKLLENNDKTYWVPSFVQEKRFANWLKDARDWAVSRNRFWGTPINLWVSDDFEEIVCPSSIEELEQLTGQKITDLHRESVDQLTIPSKTGRGVLKRVSEVFDCWFESGSMPYAQQHYPFENREIFEANFPADFIAEGIDQTRGWFYTLLVLSTALFDRPPFKNLVCHGLVLASDGNKMSKSKKNFPDPLEVVEKYGADSLRLYLINSPVVRGENLRFREEGVHQVLKDVFLPWYNAYRFFVDNVQFYEHQTGKDFVFRSEGFVNVMDHWILSFTNSLISFVHKEMDQYHLYAVVSPLAHYFETLTNVYIRLNRKRIKGEAAKDDEDRALGLSTFGHVLLQVVRLMAPFTPFFCDLLWQNLRNAVGFTETSVHFTMIPQPEDQFIDPSVERRVSAMRTALDIVRHIRSKATDATGSTKYPIKEMVVIHRDQEFLDDLKSLESYILLELNVKHMTLSQDKEKYGVRFKAEPDFKRLGSRLKKDQKVVADYLKNKATDEELEQFLNNGKMIVHGHELTSEDVSVSFTVDSASQSGTNWQAHSENKTVVLVSVELDESMQEEGLTREVINRVQKLRKEAKLVQTESATVYCTVTPANCQLASVVQKNRALIEQQTSTPVKLETLPRGMEAVATSTSDVKNAGAKIEAMLPTFTVHFGGRQHSFFVNRNGVTLDYNRLLVELRSVFDLWNVSHSLRLKNNGSFIHASDSLEALIGKTVELCL
ncbi:isoleucyl-tRNA synthetase [Aphelenchoides avenae]|nr:isoleucyl-tRNA synthetase [Aphelenchus avenae]